MKKLFPIWLLMFLPFCLKAQNDAQATKILDKVLAVLSSNDGIRAEFVGSENGFLLLKGEKFYLNNGNIQSWYDGKTQWSYVADTEEVNISNPTQEELQAINPYFILMRYKTDYNYTYKGEQTRNGVKGHEIVLFSKHSGNQETIRVFISKIFHPLAIKVEQNGRTLSEINVTSYQTDQKLVNEMFRFNRSLYPNAEIIDLR